MVSIIDGDTVVLLDSLNTQHRIRLHGIDCPERGQEFYQAAKDYLAQLCFQKHVNVEVTGKDRYKRTIGRIWFVNQDLNLAMLHAGLAFHYKQYDNSKLYAQAEASAKAKKIGIWSNPNTQPPWIYRRK